MEKVPKNLERHCEALADAIEQADQLHNLVKARTSTS